MYEWSLRITVGIRPCSYSWPIDSARANCATRKIPNGWLWSSRGRWRRPSADQKTTLPEVTKLGLWRFRPLILSNHICQKSNIKKNRNTSNGFWDRKLTLEIQISWSLKPLCQLHMKDIIFCNIWYFAKCAVWNATTLIWLPGGCLMSA